MLYGIAYLPAMQDSPWCVFVFVLAHACNVAIY